MKLSRRRLRTRPSCPSPPGPCVASGATRGRASPGAGCATASVSIATKPGWGRGTARSAEERGRPRGCALSRAMGSALRKSKAVRQAPGSGLERWPAGRELRGSTSHRSGGLRVRPCGRAVEENDFGFGIKHAGGRSRAQLGRAPLPCCRLGESLGAGAPRCKTTLMCLQLV